jgi:acyl-CoA synthetase (AMP-forming)/AMP-acid ligase II
MTKSKPILLSVFDISDPEFGEALMAVVEPQAGATLDVADIRKRAASAIAIGAGGTEDLGAGRGPLSAA